MSVRLPSILAVSVVLSAITLHEAAAETPMQVSEIRCEYKLNPLGIDRQAPRFSWKLTDSDDTPGQFQTAYRVLVASDRRKLDRDKGDMWDSGIVESPQSTLVLYAGKPLASSQECWWKVQSFDKDGNPTRWSEPARFVMGVLDPSGWGGRWIDHTEVDPSSNIWFRKSFKLRRNRVTHAIVHAASLGYHELYVNGVKADDRLLAPAQSRLDKRVLYVTYDIAPLLRKGDNTIAFRTGPGWSRYEFFYMSVHQALKARCDIVLKGGRSFSLVTDNTWKCHPANSGNTGDGTFGHNGGEWIDARAAVPDWNMPFFDDSSWPYADETDFAVELSAQDAEPTAILDTIHVQSITRGEDGSFLVDFGRNFTGMVRVPMSGSMEGDTVTLKVSNRPESSLDFNQMSFYVCSGREGEEFSNSLNFSAGRYLTIAGLRRQPLPEDIVGYQIGTNLERSGSFECSDSLYNWIYETDLWTFRNCTTEGYTSDCPHRERLGYGEVAFACEWGIALPNYNMGAMLRKLVRDWTDVQEATGWVHHTAPQINLHYGGPLWSSAGMNIAWEYYVNYGDKAILELVYPYVRRWLDFLRRNVRGGLLTPYLNGGRFLGDWAGPGQRKEYGDSPEAKFFNNCVYAYNLRIGIKMAGILGLKDDAALYVQRLDAIEKAVNDSYLDPASHCYMSGNQVQTAFPLWVEIVPEEYREQMMEHFGEDISRLHPYLDMGSSGLPVLLKFLTEKTDRFDEAVAAALDSTEEPSYGYFRKRGETTWPEYWNVDVPSRIHTCYTGIASWFIKRVGGIRPDEEEPGCQSVVIQPSFLRNLQFAKARTATQYGPVESNWERKEDGIHLTVRVPVNARATIILPEGREMTGSGTHSFIVPVQ